MKNKFNFDYKTFPYWSSAVLLVVVYFLWTKIVGLFKPEGYANEVEKPISRLNSEFLDRYWIAVDGRFLTQNGHGAVSDYTIQQAENHALQLADLMDTSKRDSWYERIFSLTVGPTPAKIKSILNPNYPSTYRRYVIRAYADVFTNGRNLQSDVRNNFSTLTGIDEMLGFGQWTDKLTRYFQL